MADRGRGRGGRGGFQQQPFPNRGGGTGHRGGASGGDRRGGFQQQPFPNRGGGSGHRGNVSRGDRGGSSFRGDRGRGGPRGSFRGGSRGGSTAIFKQDGQIHKPKDEVTQLENATFSSDLTQSLQQLQVRDQSQIPLRPAYGTKGRSITLWANYFELLPKKEQPFHRYDISFVALEKKAVQSKKDVQKEPTGKKRARLIQLLLQSLPTTIAKATDYKSTLITSQQLPFNRKSILVDYYSESEQGPTSKSPKYSFEVQYVATHTFQDLLDYLSSTDLTRPSPTTKDQIIQATNIVLASGMKANSQIVSKKNKYFPVAGASGLVESWMLATGLNAFRGFFMSVRAATGRILLNVQVQHVVVWESQSVSTLLEALTSQRWSLQEISRFISGTWVQVTHLNNRLRRVAGLAQVDDGRLLDRPPQFREIYAGPKEVRFWRTSPEPARYITVADHFKEKGLTLKQLEAPVLNVGSKGDPIYMPSENCIIKSLQTYDKKLSPDATAKMIQFAVRNAPENAEKILKNGMKLLRDNSTQVMGNFAVEVSQEMITVTARVLPAIAVQYPTGAKMTQDASWNMSNVRFTKGAKINRWSYLWIKLKSVDSAGKTKSINGGAFTDQEQVKKVVAELRKEMLACGMTTPEQCEPHVLELINIEAPEHEVESAFARIPRSNELVLVILPNESTAVYNAVKCAGDIKYGFHTVGLVAHPKKFCKSLFPNRDGGSQHNKQYHANIALKINLKFGGRNQSLKSDVLGFISEGKTMIVGLDVTHPSPGSAEKAPSVSAITASTGPELGQWPADVAIQVGRQEMVQDLKRMFTSRLKLWQNYNQGSFPKEIIVYRDGVGESMYDLVRSQELPLIQESCKELYSATETKAGIPHITIVICGKRHHTRFYPTDEAEADPRTGGTKSGTIVDRGITEARVWDFYLQAHTALQGTPRSAHYVVIHDEIFRRRARETKVKDGRTTGQQAADELERLTYALCHMYGRATKSVSLCTPAYYADLVCDRARVWLSKVFDGRSQIGSEVQARDEDVKVRSRLQNTMFYI